MGGKARQYPDDRARAILEILAETWSEAHCELDFDDPYQLTVATILSAQTTDKRVNLVTPALFARYPDATSLAEADPAEVEELVRQTGFYRQKTRAILAMARKMVSDHGGEIPRTMEEMLGLAGVARKTANVVLGNAYGIPSGIAVDTHVKRVSARLGLTEETDPVKVERDLTAIVPQDRWVSVGQQLIWHGRRICFARKPACDLCPLAPLCPSAFSFGEA